ncbi:MAG TPA: hypothetical protein VMM36_13285 [Opitutaceae bacterium]|nr:hypothetical protein [Opitutaceae bacterium]
MKPLTILLFALSLAGNATLGYFYFLALKDDLKTVESSAPSAAGASALEERTGRGAPSPDATKPAEGSATLSPATWQSINPGDDLAAMVANLRAAGFPPKVIRTMVEQMVQDRFDKRYAAVAPPYWKRWSPTQEQVAARQRLDEERSKIVENLLGDDTRPSVNLGTADREARYGSLPDEKIDAIAQIERDYEQVGREARAGRAKNMMDRMNETREQQALMEQQGFADLATVLTPEELDEFKLRNSSTASRTMNRLQSIDVTEAEYEALYREQQSYDESTANLKMVGEIDAETWAKQNAATDAFNDQVKAVLNDDRFYQYLEASDFRYAHLSKTLKAFPSVTPDATYQLLKLQQETQIAVSRLYENKAIPQAQRDAQRVELLTAASGKLDTLLGRETAAAFKKEGPGRMFVITPPAGSGGD